MIYKSEVLCPNCKKLTPAVSAAEPSYCIYCGRELINMNPSAVKSPVSDPSDYLQWEILYANGLFEELQIAASDILLSDSSSPLPKMYFCLAKLRLLYDEYEQATRDEGKKTRMSGKLQSFLLKSQSPEGTFHEVFFDGVAQYASELVASLERMDPLKPQACQLAAGDAIDLLLFYNTSNRPASVVTAYEMHEKHAKQFLRFLDTERLRMCYLKYKPIRNRRLLGNEVFKALKKELQAREAA